MTRKVLRTDVPGKRERGQKIRRKDASQRDMKRTGLGAGGQGDGRGVGRSSVIPATLDDRKSQGNRRRTSVTLWKDTHITQSLADYTTHNWSSWKQLLLQLISSAIVSTHY